MPLTKAQQHEVFIDRLGLRHFRGIEFTPYWNRLRGSVKNSVPPESLWLHIIPTIIILDELRQELGVPITLLSLYRSPTYNDAVGGEPASLHMSYKAIDFTCRSGTPATWASKLKSWRGRQFKLPENTGSFEFHGGVGVYANSKFVHLDTRGRDADW